MRRLAAILASDVVGYSRMMAADEAGTLAALKRHREATFDPTVAAHNGRIVKLIGDGALVEFGSVVDAVNCALAVQRAIAEAADEAPKLAIRIGINLGDIIIEGDDIYGDGVNVAARLEPLAEPGGVCVSSIVNESVGSRIEVTFSDGGEVRVKNIDRPIRIWKWHPGAGGPAKNAASAQESGAPAPPTASIAVLPFTNMSGDAEQEYFSDGISEDIITDLSKVAGLLVIARNSSFAYKGRSVDIRMVGRELGVNSVLEGSIRRAGNRVRITAQLIDARNGAHLWADRYDRDLTDIFAVQDDVTREIVAALKVTLTPGDLAALKIDSGVNPEAHDLLLRARDMLFRPTKDRSVFDRATALLSQAIEIDPEYAEPYSALALAHRLDYVNRWSEDPEQALAKAARFADLAVAKGPNNLRAHQAAAMIAVANKDWPRAEAESARALAINRNGSEAALTRATLEIYTGNAAAAIPLLEHGRRVDPRAGIFLHFLGVAFLLTGKFETAAAMFRERILLAPETDFSRALLVATLGYLGRDQEARQVWTELMAINPAYSFGAHVGRMPFQKDADADLIRRGFQKTGIVDRDGAA
jgi:adenylate cyclase